MIEGIEDRNTVGIEVYDVLSKDECNSIISSFERDRRIEPGLVSQTVNVDKKKSTDLKADFTNNIEYGEYNNIILPALVSAKDEYLKKYPQLSNGPRFNIVGKYNIQRYVEGEGYFAEHCEHSGMYPYRMLVWSMFLNDAKCGTYFTQFDKTIPAVGGSLIIFPAFWLYQHRGVVPNIGVKYIATGWWEYDVKTIGD